MSLQKIIASTLIFLFFYGVIEVLSLLIYQQTTRKDYSSAELAALRQEVTSPTKMEESGLALKHLALHPFVGYVSNYRPHQKSTDFSIMKNGYHGEEDVFEAGKDPNKIIVGVTGGSLAINFLGNNRARDILRSYIQQVPAFLNKKIVIVAFCQGAYQQPQALFSVAYHLLQGGRIDLLVNLDGHNEAIYGFDNQERMVHPNFPVYWPTILGNSRKSHSGAFYNLAEAVMWKKMRVQAAKIADKLSFSATASTLWFFMDHYFATHAAEAELQYHSSSQKGEPYYVTGPDTMQNASKEKMVQFILSFWKHASLDLQALSKKYGFSYFHFLQPNQYIAGSKPLSAEEKEKYYTPEHFRSQRLIYAYPFFEKGIQELHKQGVEAYSLIDIFKHSRETLYRDSCCHVNEAGNMLIAHAMGKRIIAHFPGATSPALAP